MVIWTPIPYFAIVVLRAPRDACPEPVLERRRATDVVPAEAIGHHANSLCIRFRPRLKIVNRGGNRVLVGGAADKTFLASCSALSWTLQHQARETIAQRRNPCDEVDLRSQRFESTEQDNCRRRTYTARGRGKEGVHGASLEGNANLLEMRHSPAKRLGATAVEHVLVGVAMRQEEAAHAVIVAGALPGILCSRTRRIRRQPRHCVLLYSLHERLVIWLRAHRIELLAAAPDADNREVGWRLECAGHIARLASETLVDRHDITTHEFFESLRAFHGRAKAYLSQDSAHLTLLAVALPARCTAVHPLSHSHRVESVFSQDHGKVGLQVERFAPPLMVPDGLHERLPEEALGKRRTPRHQAIECTLHLPR